MSAPIVVETVDTVISVEVSETPGIDIEVLENFTVVEVEIPQFQIVDVSTPGPQGAKGEQGEPGTSATSQYRHSQITPSTRWAIVHNLQRMPTSCLLWDQAHGEIDGDIEDPATSDDPTHVLYVNYSNPQMGSALVS